ncbi:MULTISPECIES: hypothetical protein [unclassified Prochlorococcus]|nr:MULTISPECIES: hypothetical protein [unclassified Prochlorococcus]KGG16192.1 hypothetical protein EV07_1359 [Prochlorococcus sp. MIT 0603]KGG18073.1 hypothetical protein EV06_0201 [Prochlorococcus sp. MIT 0602]
MPISKDILTIAEEKDSIDSYFECIASCGIDEKDNECVTECLEVHLKQN